MKTFELLETCYVTLSISPYKREEIFKLLKENDIDSITIGDNYKNGSKIYARLTLDTKEKIKAIINTGLDVINYHQKNKEYIFISPSPIGRRYGGEGLLY